jgi:hypothetical protein
MDKITLVMINNDLIPKVQAKRHSRDAEVFNSLKIYLYIHSIFSSIPNSIIENTNFKLDQMNVFLISVYGVNHGLILTYQILIKNVYYSVM